MKRKRFEPLYLLVLSMFILTSLAFINHKNVDQKIESAFKKAILKYNPDPVIAGKLWREIVQNYSGPDRHYHNMEHLQNFYSQLNKCKKLIKDPELLLIAMAYHDVIYNSEDHKDEERSAKLAVERLKEIGYPENKILKCEQLILATKSHALSTDEDTNLFNDADMTILGLDRETYQRYVKNVRLEYSNSPQFDAGRKRVLQYFLGMKNIYKTDFFHQLYEKPARENITWELTTL